MKKFILLLLLLLSVIVLQKVLSKTEPVHYYNESDMYVLASSTPTYIKQEVRATRIENEFINIIKKYDWNSNIAYAVMMAESSGNPNAFNSGDNHRVCRGSYGLFQMGCVHFGHYGLTWDNRFDIEQNIHSAYLLYSARGWKEWGAFTSGAYRTFLK
jgi:hypothetical protein